MTKRITTDDLAIMINAGFVDVDRKFDEIRKEMSDRFDGVDKRFASVDKRFASVDKRFDGIENRLENLEIGQQEIKSVMSQAATKSDVKLLDRRVTKIEQQVGLV